MFDKLQGALLRLLRVPPEPAAPLGGRVIRVFRASPRYYTLKLLRWGLVQAGVLLGVVAFTIGLVFETMGQNGDGDATIALVLIGLVWSGFLIQLACTYALLRLDYDLRWYIVTDRSLRIRDGLIRVNEKTMTFANIQHLTVRQGPLQRLLGLADLEVRSAGGGGSPGAQPGQPPGRMDAHTAYFRGVDNVEEIRSTIRDRIRLYRDAGLGDPDDTPSLPRSAPTRAPDRRALVAAIRELGNEARALRDALTGTELSNV